MLFGRAKEEFNIVPVVSDASEQLINACIRAYQGHPDWVDKDDHIKTINFAKSVCSETARLAVLGIKIQLEGSARAEWLQEQVDRLFFQLRDWVEYGCACGTVVLKPNGDNVDLYLPGRYMVTDAQGGKIQGIVFFDYEDDEANKRYYTRMEYHRFIDGQYVITNRCYVGGSHGSTDKVIAIEKTPWVGLLEEAFVEGLEGPLFAVMRMPHANNADMASPVSLPLVSDALEELKDLDIAYSRNAKEIKDSKRTVLLDSDALIATGTKVVNTGASFEARRKEMQLPDYVRNVTGDGTSTFYQEINPELNTEMRMTGINALLSQIGFKIGYSNGYFVFDEKTGMVTATQVESDDRRTIQFIKDVRDKLEDCMNSLIYALNAFADLYDYAPVGDYEAVYDFGDITYNREEDRVRWWGYVQAGKVPAWQYFVKFEGMTEEDAKVMTAEAQPKQPTLFGGEE